jgi:hypothetical protein
MKDFFVNLTLARWIILLSLLSSIGLGYYGYTLHARRVGLEDALSGEVRRVALDTRNKARRFTVLQKQSEREGLEGQSDPVSYIRRIAASSDVKLGDTTVDPPSEAENIKGVLDTRYSIKPSSRDRGFPRLNIANFLYKLESESRRMRVTRVSMEPEAKSTKPELVLDNDSWRWEAEVTSRTKIEAPPAPVKKQ